MSWANKFSNKTSPVEKKSAAPAKDETSQTEDCYIQNLRVVNVGVISTQEIELTEAIAMANKVHPLDTLENEMIIYKQPAEGEEEAE